MLSGFARCNARYKDLSNLSSANNKVAKKTGTPYDCSFLFCIQLEGEAHTSTGNPAVSLRCRPLHDVIRGTCKTRKKEVTPSRGLLKMQETGPHSRSLKEQEVMPPRSRRRRKARPSRAPFHWPMPMTPLLVWEVVSKAFHLKLGRVNDAGACNLYEICVCFIDHMHQGSCGTR